MKLSLCPKAYDDVTDFESCGFHQNRKKLDISRPKHYFFFKQKSTLTAHQGLTEVAFNGALFLPIINKIN